MTQNQIAYWKMKEERDNNLRQYDLNTKQYEEQKRSNLEKERETRRSNRVNEAHTKYRIDLDSLYQRRALNETQRSNIARETETSRTNRRNEEIREQSNVNQASQNQSNYLIGMTQANAARRNASINALNAENTRRNTTLNYQVNQRMALNAEKATAASIRRNANEYELGLLNASVNRARLNADIKRNILNYEVSLAGLENERQRIQEQIRHNQTSEYLNAASTALITGLKLGIGGRK